MRRTGFHNFLKGDHNDGPKKKVNLPEFNADIDSIDRILRGPRAILSSKLEAAMKVRKQLIDNKDLTLREIVDREWVSVFSKLISGCASSEEEALRIEGLWVLLNLASGSSACVKDMVKHGCVESLASILKPETNHEILEQCTWILGNMACESVSTRDFILRSGVIPCLVVCLRTSIESVMTSLDEGFEYTCENLIAATKGREIALTNNNMVSLLRIGSWTISNLCDGQPRPVLDHSSVEIGSVLPILCELLHCNDCDILSHTSWAFSHLCDLSSAHIRAVTSSGWTADQIRDEELGLKRGGGICKRLVELLAHPSNKVVKPALRAIGNIVCAEEEIDYTPLIIEAGVLPHLKKLILSDSKDIQKEACWTLSNIAAGSTDQIDKVFALDVVGTLVSLAKSTSADLEVRLEASWFILNATSCGTDEQIQYMIDQGSVSVLGHMLSDTTMTVMALEGLERVLQVGQGGKLQKLIPPDLIPDASSTVGSSASIPKSVAVASTSSSDAKSNDGCGRCKDCRKSAELSSICFEKGTGLPTVGVIADYHKGASSSMYGSSRSGAPDAMMIAKQASLVWKEYFATCALCMNSYSKVSETVIYCLECKCFVCRKCDCYKFHMSYQESFWMDEETKEGSKSSKSKAKKLKQKEKLKLKKASAGCTAGASLVSSSSLDMLQEDSSAKSQAELIEQEKIATEISSLQVGEQKSFEELFPEDQFDDSDGDLVDFLQETGSILALADKLGIK